MTPILKVEKLTKCFGDFCAVKNVSLEVMKEEIVALIGPNGAGKTTFYNVLTGRYKATSGRVIFCGKDITNLSPHRIVRLGLSRSFQITNIFLENTVLENLLAPILIREGLGLAFLKKLHKCEKQIQEAHRILELIGLSDKADVPASLLAYGDKRAVEIGIVLAAKPKMVLLDEPTAGMTPVETDKMISLIKKLFEETKITFLITEHDMKVVFSIAKRIFVLHQGELLAQGTPEEIRANPKVREAYLGGSVDA